MAPSQLHEHMGAAVPEYVNVTELTSGSCGSAHVRVELARRQTLRHPSGECDNTAPGSIRFPTQFHLPTINSISVIINLQGQPSSGTPCIISARLCYQTLWKRCRNIVVSGHECH